MKRDRGQVEVYPIWTLVVVIVAVLVAITGQTVMVNHLDAACEHTLGENVTALEEQPILDGQLDCQYPNGTVVYDVEPKPMNLTSGGKGVGGA